MDQKHLQQLQNTLISGLAQTENRILTQMAKDKSDLKIQITKTNNKLDHLQVDIRLVKEDLQFLKEEYGRDMSDVATKLLTDKEVLQQRLNQLQEEINKLQKRIAAM
ncbi:hypothetical protein SAMN05444392_101340 [Seinonella peptonophila]|uniref:Uncharacterized protein n=1 Tax=Seinonella peptonophila TaxID=112248 RepID=A0A1M4T7E9_9BACL|nr:hypothetical protein [Seinonella peptonophila]SHE40268.1 hypothetical protein SAMN05444392_101340 [Seinonella peptonophila]